MKKTDGFSLIELVVGILASALVSGAIITFLLMGIDTSNATFNANADQRNAKIVISMLEQLAGEGNIKSLKIDGSVTPNADGELVETGTRSWYLYGADSTVLLSYSPAEQKLYSRNTVIMENVTASMLTLSPSPLGGCLLGFALQTPESFYETSVYNRLAAIATEGLVLDKNNFAIIDSDPNPNHPNEDPTSHRLPISSQAGRTAFLNNLISQYGSTGTIIQNGVSSNIPYSLWYCNGSYSGDWNEDTPWCACFVSWAAAKTENSGYMPSPYGSNPVSVLFANVHNFWSGENPTYPSFKGQKLLNVSESVAANNANNHVTPGDLIFFDWQRTAYNSTYNLDHVGVVLFIDEVNQLIYTIEGNSGNQVALRRYAFNNPQIVGFGILDWTTSS